MFSYFVIEKPKRIGRKLYRRKLRLRVGEYATRITNVRFPNQSPRNYSVIRKLKRK